MINLYTNNTQTQEIGYIIGYTIGLIIAIIVLFITIRAMLAIINISQNITVQNELKRREIELKESEMEQNGMTVPPKSPTPDVFITNPFDTRRIKHENF